MKLSVVVIARNEGAELARTAANLCATLPRGSEFVVVDDGSRGRVALPPRSGRIYHVHGLGVARARNFGAARTSGDVLVFADAHIRVEEGWWRPLLDILENPKAGAASPAITHLSASSHIGYGLSFKGPDLSVAWLPKKSDRPFPVPIIPGCCLAMRRDTFSSIGGWDDGLMHRGGVDNELSVRMWTLGYDLYIAPSTLCCHLFRTRSPYHVGWPEYLHNRLRLAMVHFSAARMAKVVAALSAHKHFGAAMELVLADGTGERRREMLTCRVRTDNQFFRRFAIPW